jgi:hypothetical protein
MRLRICSLLGVAVALVSLAGCQKRASFDPVLAGAFFPLRPGSSWTYRFTDKSRNTMRPRAFRGRCHFQN